MLKGTKRNLDAKVSLDGSSFGLQGPATLYIATLPSREGKLTGAAEFYLAKGWLKLSAHSTRSDIRVRTPLATQRALIEVSLTSALTPEQLELLSRQLLATNERNAHAPKTVAEYKAAHGPGCGCCSTGKKKPARLVTKTKSGTKGFPTARPWMISH